MSAEEQKIAVEAPKEEVVAPIVATEPVAVVEPVVEAPVVVAPVTTEAVAEAPAAETIAPVETPAVADAPVVAAPEAAKATEESKDEPKEEVKEELKVIEEGTLEHKGVGFPRNLIFSKQHFHFGTDAVESKDLAAYLKNEKHSEHAFHNVAWATKTGAGLLFFGEKKETITGVINLAETTEPEVDGNSKFHFTANGVKHAFKAHSKIDRDSWVAQLKSKIAEAKLATASVTESEEYKAALEGLKSANKKEEKVVEDKKEEPVEAAVVPPVTEEAAKEEAKKDGEAATEESGKEEAKTEVATSPGDSKVRSSSRKRLSTFFSSKTIKSKKDEATTSPTEEAPVVVAEDAAPVVESADKPVEETPAVVDAPVVAEDKAVESPKEEEKTFKPSFIKRTSFFDMLKPKKDSAPVADTAATTDEAPVEPAVVSDAAPTIPPVETTTPLAAEDVAAPAASTVVAPETTEETAAVPSPTEKTEVKNDKRKSSIPFVFGKKEKPAVAASEETEKKEKDSHSLFSRFRNTVKGRSEKPAEKTEEKSAEKIEETAEETPAVVKTPEVAPVAAEETPVAVVDAPIVAAETEDTKEVVPAVAPVTAAA